MCEEVVRGANASAYSLEFLFAEQRAGYCGVDFYEHFKIAPSIFNCLRCLF